MCISYIISVIAIAVLIYVIILEYNKYEQFYPYRGWGTNGWGGRWGWKKPYLNDIGNWRPYQYYPAYSGYWKQCEDGSWSPPYTSCIENLRN